MKQIKTICKALIILVFISACTENDNLDFLENTPAPTNVAAIYDITQDNTGVVTIKPTADGAIAFDIFYGDATPEPERLEQGKTTTHTYAEGTYDLKVVAYNSVGKTTELIQQLVVSFQAPQNLVVTVENDAAISKQVNINSAADFATVYEFYSGETGVTQPVLTGNIGETINYQYADAGTYDIKIIAKGGAIATTEYSESFEVTAILAPLASVATPPSRNEIDVISIFSDAYTDVTGTNLNPNWGQQTVFSLFDLNGDAMIQYSNLNYQGIDIGSEVDASAMETLHIDIWTADATSIDIFPLPNGVQPADEKFVTKTLIPNQWNSFDIPMSDFTDQGLPVNNLKQFKFVGAGTVFIDNLYFYKTPSAASVLTGTWRVPAEAGSLKVGPSRGSGEWWSIDDAGVAQRGCYFDDEYVFGADFSFKNVLGADTWLEGWQGASPDACGTPVAPHIGSDATFIHDAANNKVTITGEGSYLGLPKVLNTGELPNVPITSSITYDITLSNNNTEMEVSIEAGSGVFWSYKLVKDGAVATSPIEGTWKVAEEEGSLKVGPSAGSGEWFAINAAQIAERACYFDDEYVFSGTTFQNVLGSETWLEGWQGGADNCGAPIAPHDGSVAATFEFDASANTLKLNGKGAYLGLPKVNNANELTDPANAPDAITYNVTLSENNTVMDVLIEAGSGVFWSYKLVKQ